MSGYVLIAGFYLVDRLPEKGGGRVLEWMGGRKGARVGSSS